MLACVGPQTPFGTMDGISW